MMAIGELSALIEEVRSQAAAGDSKLGYSDEVGHAL